MLYVLPCRILFSVDLSAILSYLELCGSPRWSTFSILIPFGTSTVMPSSSLPMEEVNEALVPLGFLQQS